jgi:putative ABC transport system permease protein
MRRFNLAWQLLRRDWRSGELTTLIFALVIAVTAVLTIALASERLTRGMGEASAELIGGDLLIESTREPDNQWQTLAENLGIRSSQAYHFDSVVLFKDEMLLCGVKAVDPSYPLLGNMEIADGPNQPATPTRDIPVAGTAWADSRVLERLGAKVGDNIYFGAISLKITKVLTFEPDQGNSLFQFAPRLMVNRADLERARILGPGSRIKYRSLFASTNIDAIDSFKKQLELAPGHKLITPENDDNRASAALLKATQYIRIATLLAIILSAIAIALCARRFSDRHVDISAMLRTLGASRRDILRLYLYQLLLLGLIATGISAILGWLAHLAILEILAPFLPNALPYAGPKPWLSACGSALLLLAGFALPPVLRLANTPPLRVLRRDLQPPPLSSWLLYGLGASSQGLLLWLLFDDLASMLLILLAVAVVFLLIGVLLYVGLRSLKKLPLGSSLWNRSVRNLGNHAATATSQVLAFSLTLMLVLVITQLRTGLLEEWQVHLPDDAPNYFAFNIFPNEVADFSSLVSARADLRPLYPVVRGRMLSINGDASRVEDGGDNRRELNFSSATALPADNRVIAGEWPPGPNGVSVEQEYAERLELSLGDTMTFDVTGQTFTATVTSFRTVEWESFSPNFYLMFQPEMLKDLPQAYLTSFYLNPEHSHLTRELISRFPALNLIDVSAIIGRMQVILGQISLSVELVMIFVLLSGFGVLFAVLQTTSEERTRESALMRAMGASRRYLQKAYLMEFGLIGALSGSLAVLGSEIIVALVYARVLELTYSPAFSHWLLIPAGATLLVAVAGYWGARKVLRTSPASLLAS